MWHLLVGTPKLYTGTAPTTVTLGAGEIVIGVLIHATTTNGTVAILGQPAITAIAGAPPTWLGFNHTLFQVNANSNSVVFAGGVDAYAVHTVKQGNT